MSLQVWLPLTKDLRQQGLSNIIAINNGATYSSTEGKLGGCYSFDGSDDFISLNGSALYNIIKGGSIPFSITMWIYHADSTRAILFGDYSLSGAINFNIELNASHSVRFYWAGSPDASGGHTLAILNTWTHIAIVYDGSKINFYMNGELKDTYAVTLSTKTKTSGSYYIGRDYRTGTTALNGKINDFRIYDHALSQMEVKELAKGLVLHYTLSDGYIESTLNYLGEKSDTFTSWGSYGFGSKGTITIDTTQTAVCGGQVAKLTNKTTETSNSTVEMATIFTSVASTVMQKNEKFTISAYVKGNDSTIGKSCWLHIYNTNGTNTSSIGGQSIVLTDKWQRVTYTYTWPYDAPSNNSGNCYVCVSMKGGESIYICNVQVEKKDHATSFTNSSRTSNIVYDSSGFCNNGTISGALTIASDTPKYKYSIQMPAAATVSHTRCLDNTNQEWSCAAWVKPTTAGNYQNLNNFNESNRLYHGTYPLLYANSGTNDYYNYGNLALPANQWSHIVFVFKNSTGTKLIYVNGENHTNTSGPNKTSTPKGIPDTVVIGSGNYEGGLCDYREYATALSADDVKSLYQNCATIDPDGTIRGQIRD